jgi:hypothetical protein
MAILVGTGDDRSQRTNRSDGKILVAIRRPSVHDDCPLPGLINLPGEGAGW